MPKKGKKGKKKSVVVINPEITIVDEGESSLDVEDAIRQKNIALHTQPSIEIASEAQESRSVSVDSANAEMNSFTISKCSLTALIRFLMIRKHSIFDVTRTSGALGLRCSAL